MNPDKLFDYLDGKLSPGERTQLEEKLMSDAQLRQQFNVAREIHRGGGVTREVIVPSEDAATIQRSAIMTRRIVLACIVLVFVNVFIGIAVIAGKNKRKADVSSREAGIRKQLATSLGAAAENALPVPSFVAQEIHLTAPRPAWQNVATRVIAAAATFDGSAVQGLPAEDSMNVVVDIPSSREKEFRQAITSAASIAPMPAIGQGPSASAAPPPNERTIVQVRIAETAP